MVQSQQSHRPPLRSVLEAYVNVTTAAYTAKAGDRVIGVNRAGAVTITLPTAEVRKGRTYTIKDESGAAATNTITVDTEGSETIDGSATDVISADFGGKTYYSDGTNWFELPLLAAASVAHADTTGQTTDQHHAQAHSLASHSSEAHSELTGVGTDDHHAQSHTTPAASTTAAGHAELATTAETNTGTDTGRVVTPDGLAGSVHGEAVVQMVVFDFGSDVATGDGKLNGMNLVRVHAEVITAGTTGTTDIQIANATQSADILSTKLTIDSGETGSDSAASAAVINTAEDDMQTNDVLRVDVDAVSTTAPKGLIVTLTFRLP